jgi:signal peptidase II
VSARANRAWRLAAVLCAVVVAADQAAKAAVEGHLVPGQEVDVLGPVGLTLSHNRGVAFGIAGGAGATVVLLTLVALAAVGVVFARNPTRPLVWPAVGLLAGGALGNLADRVRAGAVTDFVAVGAWPPFNLADVAITVGVVLLALAFLREIE